MTTQIRIEPKELAKHFQEDWELVGLASVELPDLKGDVIKIDGITRASETFLPILSEAHAWQPTSDHRLGAEEIMNITAAIVGELVRIEVDTPSGRVPALAFGAKYRRENNGSLAPSAERVKAMMESDNPPGFSIAVFSRASTTTARPIRGEEIRESLLYEISVTSSPCNPHAIKLAAPTFGQIMGAKLDRIADLYIKSQKAAPAVAADDDADEDDEDRYLAALGKGWELDEDGDPIRTSEPEPMKPFRLVKGEPLYLDDLDALTDAEDARRTVLMKCFPMHDPGLAGRYSAIRATVAERADDIESMLYVYMPKILLRAKETRHC